MTKEHLADILKIAREYQQNFKPLLETIKVRNNNKYPLNCLNEIRAINDHIARCYRDDITDNEIIKNIGKAEGHLQRLGYDCFKQLITYQVADIKYTVKRYYSSRWLYIGKGELWNSYLTNFKEGYNNEKRAKEKESINSTEAFEYYEKAFNSYHDVSVTFQKYRSQISRSYYIGKFERMARGMEWFIMMIILAVLSSLLTLLLDRYF